VADDENGTPSERGVYGQWPPAAPCRSTAGRFSDPQATATGKFQLAAGVEWVSAVPLLVRWKRQYPASVTSEWLSAVATPIC